MILSDPALGDFKNLMIWSRVIPRIRWDKQ